MSHLNLTGLQQTSYLAILRASMGLSVIAIIVCGFLYSSIVTGLGQFIFSKQSNGSLLELNGKVVGSYWVAQPFSAAQYFQSRPSAADYNPMQMSGSNLAQHNPELQRIIQQRLDEVSRREHISVAQIPSDLVTASASGIDPDISVQSAKIQVKRIAAARQLTEQQVNRLIQQYTTKTMFGVFGEARINVLALNLALDQNLQ